jgi:hypothetical protein
MSFPFRRAFLFALGISFLPGGNMVASYGLRVCASFVLVAVLHPSAAAQLSRHHLRDIDNYADELEQAAKELHDEFHLHLQGQRYAAKLDEDVTELETLAEHFHELVHNAGGRPVEVQHLREDSYQLLQLSHRIPRSLDRIRPTLVGSNAQRGAAHMQDAARQVRRIATRIDAMFPVQWSVVDEEADRLASYCRELHQEFHDHLDHYQLAAQIEAAVDLIERRAEHMHELAHESSGGRFDSRHLRSDLDQIFSSTRRIDDLLDRQARIGLTATDWDGVIHMRGVLTDVEGSAYMLQHLLDRSIRRGHAHPSSRVREPRRLYDESPLDRFRRRDDHHGHHEHDEHGDDHFGVPLHIDH